MTKIRVIRSDLQLDPDVREGLQRLQEEGEDPREIGNQAIRDYLMLRKILPIPEDPSQPE